MILEINIALEFESQMTIEFFWQYINKNTDWLYSQEFICPFWIKWAIKRKQILLSKNENKIIWSLRFYKQKRKDIVSLYQFAISETYRWKWLLFKMLESINCSTIHSRCLIASEFNKYYEKTGRILIKRDDLWNLREMKIGKNFSP